MISFFSNLFTQKFSHHISKYKEGIEENVNSSIFFFQDLCQLWTMGWHFILIDDCCTGNPVVCLSTQTKFWYEVCSVWSSPQVYIVQCNLLCSISKQSIPYWYSKWCQTFLNWLLKGWMKVDLSNFPFFVNEKFQIAPNYSYGSSTINFSNVIFLELQLEFYHTKTSESIISILMCS